MSQNLLQVSNGHKAFGSQVIFDQTTFSINSGEHVGVIGPNGAGKTTLFKVLVKDEELDQGQVVRSQNLRLGYLSQHDNWLPEETGHTYLERICKIPVWQAKALGKDLQITEEILTKPILSLSGGYRMRVKLIGMLGMDPNLMLLDEPTNYLDLETTLLLERFLQNYEGAFLLISHDREILRRTTDHILEVEGGEVVKFNGNIDDYFEQKELMRSQLEAQATSQALKRKAILDFVNRFGAKATKAKQAQSRLKSLQKMETIEFKALPISASIQIPKPPHVGKVVLKLDKVDLGYPERTVLKNISLSINRGDHVAVVGLNGEGKSTLLKGLAGSLDPLKGTRELGYQVELAIFNQHVVEVLDPQHTVYESLESVCSGEVTPQEIRNMAGSLLFSSDHIQKKVKVLSGGEKSRVALGRILLQKVSCLLLDEPTNHLDFQTVEALTQALNKYEGTLIVVSHDRGFIRRVGTRILEVSKGSVLLYPGTYDEYVWSLQQKLAGGEELKDQAPVKVEKKKEKENSDEKPGVVQRDRGRVLRQIERELDLYERQMEKLSKENEELNEKIVNTDPMQSGELNDLIQKLSDNSSKIQDIEAKWLARSEDREKL